MRRMASIAVAVAVAALAALALGHGGAAGTATGAGTTRLPTDGDSFEPQLGVPASGVVAFGSSTGEAEGETWAYGVLGQTPVYVDGKPYSNQYALLHRSTKDPIWEVMPLPESPANTSGPIEYGALAGRVTQDGSVVLLSGERIFARAPGGQPKPVPTPAEATEEEGKGGAGAEVLKPGESVLPPDGAGERTVPYAAIEESGGRVGVLIAPYLDGGKQSASGQPESQPGVLHYDTDTRWTREAVQAEGERLDHFQALAISCAGTAGASEASSPENCWLLAAYGAHGPERLALYRRVRDGEPSDWTWRPQPVADTLLGSEPLPGNTTVSPLGPGAQMLTATAQGVWVDFDVHVSGLTAPVSVSKLVLAPAEANAKSKVAGTWCFPTGLVCTASLGAPLPPEYRSFAWSGSSEGDSGTRVITGLPEGAMLELAGGSYAYTAGDGGEPGSKGRGGAAMYLTPEGRVEGEIADGVLIEQQPGGDDEGQSPVVGLITGAEEDRLHEESVPFRQPLLAVAQAPGTAPGNPNAEALAVGVEGQVGRFVPGEGWQPEALLNGEHKPVEHQPNLRGVAWPEPERAYAVGDKGEMWMWMRATGYWVPDPAKPFNFKWNLTAIAFEPGNPQVGFAVGKQGALLKYGKSWEEIVKQPVKRESKRLEAELKVEEWRLNFTSVAFAGDEGLASYRYVVAEDEYEAGGLLVYNDEPVCVQEDQQLEHEGKHLLEDERACWHADTSAAALLAQQPSPRDTVLSKVAGLRDGGAVAAGPDLVIERESPESPWRLSETPLPEAQNISALAAYREPSGQVRAIVSIDLDHYLDPNNSPVLDQGDFKGDAPLLAPGQPPPEIPADPLPDSGYVLKQTAGGWSDMEHGARPVRGGQIDLPLRPTPVFAVSVSENGGEGLAVGGQTYDTTGIEAEPKGETAGAMRYPVAGGQGEAHPAPLAAPSGQVSLVVGGEANCEVGCADLANEDIGADVWLAHAVQTASQVSGARAFVYLGARAAQGTGTEAFEAYEREAPRFEELLSAPEALPAYADPSTFKTVLTAGAPEQPQPCGCEPGANAYAVSIGGASATEGKIRLIMLDFSGAGVGSGQREWLERELRSAYKEGREIEPAIVAGRDSLGFDQSGVVTLAPEAEAISKILVQGHAAAYLFDDMSVDVKTAVEYRGKSIPAYGTGTLGPNEPGESAYRDELHSSAILVVSVNVASQAVSVKAVPNIGQLSLHAVGGVLLQRSHQAVFEGLARRPLAGIQAKGNNGNGTIIYPSMYDPIPADCQGPNCTFEVPLEYTVTSSKPDVGGFVVHEAASASAEQVQLNAKEEPIPDEPRNAKHELNPGDRFNENPKGEPVNERGEVVPAAQSVLFCAYNEGTTMVTITTGGLSYSMPVKVQGGSAEHPCGTVPLENPPTIYEQANEPVEVPNIGGGLPPGANPQISSLVPPPPPKLPHPKVSTTGSPPLLPSTPAALVPVPFAPLPPAPNLPRPTPPSGTAQVPSQSPVSQQVSVAEREEEVEGAYQHVQNMAAYQHEEPVPTWPIALIVIAAAAAAGLRPRRDREAPVFAWARAWRRDR